MKGKVCSASKDKKGSLLKESDATLEPEEPRGPCQSVSQSGRNGPTWMNQLPLTRVPCGNS